MMNRMRKVMAPAGADGATGGGSALTSPDPAVVAAAAAKAAAEGAGTTGGKTEGEVNTGIKTEAGNTGAFVLPDNWQSKLPDDIKDEPVLKKYTDFNTMVKSLVHAQKAIGADKVVKPGKNATDADWKAFWKSTGVIPESLDKYDVKTPDIFAQDKEVIDNLKKVAFESDIQPKAFQKIMDVYAESIKGLTMKQQSYNKQLQDTDIAGLKTEWGAKYDSNIAKAKQALAKFGDDNLRKILDTTGLGSNSAIIKAFAKMGENLVEDGISGEGSSGEGLYTPKEALSKAQAIQADLGSPFNNAQHPNHKAAVAEVQGLYKQAFPE